MFYIHPINSIFDSFQYSLYSVIFIHVTHEYLVKSDF